MPSISISMLRDGNYLSLADILSRVPADFQFWVLLEFHGIGVAPDGTPMVDFETRVRALGHRMGRREFEQFAAAVEQVWDCVVVGTPTDLPISKMALDRMELPERAIVIEAIDSTLWQVSSPTSSIVSSLKADFDS
jgi:hypothetical protein